MKLWQKGYQLNKDIETFTFGEDQIIDRKLVKYDCLASMVHADMLEKKNVLSKKELALIVKELKGIIDLVEQGEFKISSEDEDCHTALENHLTVTLGDTGKKIHTFRSRNDQVITALRLYYKDELLKVKIHVKNLCATFAHFQEKFGEVKLPGFTHTRKAMPSSINIWIGAFIASMEDNLELMDVVIHLINQSPMGSGAGYGVPSMDIKRKYMADKIGFGRVQENPLYVQNSRGKFEASILNSLSLIMFDLNKLSTELILFTMPEFGFFQIPIDFLTGSSIMPHKKNPDFLELIRAYYHRIITLEIQVKSMASNLISGYHRDLQLTKKPIIEGFEITQNCLSVMNLLFKKLMVNKANCQQALTDELFTVEEVYRLVSRGIPFRDAYKIISKKLTLT
jgi:argininosuccinate lyase